MHRRFLLISLFVIGQLMLTGATLAGEKDLLLCLPGFPGTKSQAQPYLDKMLRHLESKLKWPENSMSGSYIPEGEIAASSLKEKKPGIALVGPSVYAELHKELGMKIIAKVEVNGRGEENYAVITRKDGPKSLAELSGKSVEGAIVHNEKYVYNVLLNRELEPGKLTLVSQKRPLKALRDVVRGKVDAAIVDESVREHLSELPFADDLKVIFTSKPVPAPVVVVMGKGKGYAQKLREVLVGMCSQPDGRDLCKTLTLSSVKAAKYADYKELLSRYNH